MHTYTRHHEQVGHYHAEMPQQDRERTHRQWSQGKIPCICATVAFGMGINKVRGGRGWRGLCFGSCESDIIKRHELSTNTK